MVLAAGISGQQGDTAAASDRATFITGATIAIDGGSTCMLPS